MSTQRSDGGSEPGTRAPLRGAAARVQEALDRAGVDLRVVQMPASTRTAAEAAAAVGCSVAEIAKSLVFRAADSDRAVLVIASGVNRVDERRLGTLLGERIERADADFVRRRTGYAIGGVPPLGHSEALVTYLDRSLLALPSIWAAAGTPNSVFRLTPEQLVSITGAEVADVCSGRGASNG
jgi:prolyl-tRNA editing enzyme YbaK/EbsC (Cys-tRNA(Pro) deacylase)